MSRAATPSAALITHENPALRAPSRGRQAQRRPSQPHGAASVLPFSRAQLAKVSVRRGNPPNGTLHAMTAGASGRRASGAGSARPGYVRSLYGWQSPPATAAATPNPTILTSAMHKQPQSHVATAAAAAAGIAASVSITSAATTATVSASTTITGWAPRRCTAAGVNGGRSTFTAAPRHNVLAAGCHGIGFGAGFHLPPPCPPVPPNLHTLPTTTTTHHHQHHQHKQRQYQKQQRQHQRHPDRLRCSSLAHGAGFGGSLHMPLRAQRLADARFRLQAIRSSGAATSGSGQWGSLKEGSLVEYEKNDRGVLAVLVAPDGKKNWFAVDQTGRRQSITPKQVQLVLPGSDYTEADVAVFAAAAEDADMSLLEIAWEIAAETGTAMELPELAILLYEDTTPKVLYITHRMLQRDTLYFKSVSRGSTARSYIPRAADDVAALRRQQEAAEAARQEAEAWRSVVASARSVKTRSQLPSVTEWQMGQFADRIAALKAIALGTPRTDDVTMQLALSSLQLAGAGSRAEPDVAAALLSDIGAFRHHEPLQLLRRGLALQSPPDQEQEALALLASPPPDLDAASREDLTHLPVFTIDDAATTEVDDGLSMERLPGGVGIRIWIHVADPTRWIRPGSNLDVAGRERIRTLYLPWGSVPMFPRQLAEGPFSLREGEVCDAMSVSVVLGKDGSLERPRVVPSRVRVSHKLTYDQADAVLAAGPVGEVASAAGSGTLAALSGVLDAEVVADLVALRDAADLRRTYREARGCIEIPLPEAKIHVPYSHLDRVRPAVEIKRISQWESISRGLVAEMMILAGEAIGTIGAEAALPLPYRGQSDPPDLPSDRVLAELPEGPCRGFALKRCMTRSSVTASPQRHASLALDAYVQFTSPIRRYADMLAHHNLKAWLRGEPLPFSGNNIETLVAAAGEAARELGAVERESENYWIAEYLRLNWGAEYPAMVLGWQREELQLAAFLLEREGLEVVVRVPQGTSFSPGDCCVLVPTEVNTATGFYRFCVAGWTSGADEADEEEEVEQEVGEAEAKAEEDAFQKVPVGS